MAVAMNGLFLWNGWHAGDILMLRPLLRCVQHAQDGPVAVGCYRNHAYLLQDLGVDVFASEFDDADGPDSRSPLDLSYLCPRGFVPINTWVGNYPDLIPPSWPTMVEAFNRQCAEQGLSLRLHSRAVPSIDFPHLRVAIRPNGVYVENGQVRSGHSRFAFDVQRLAREFPTLNFYCTAHPHTAADNVFDCSHLNLVELSSLSNRCVALVGKGSGPFVCTLTSANRYKPRAIMNFHDPLGTKPPLAYRFWDFPGSPLEYLESHEELTGFLRRVAGRAPLRLL
jgi:hypothetical protein